MRDETNYGVIDLGCVGTLINFSRARKFLEASLKRMLVYGLRVRGRVAMRQTPLCPTEAKVSGT